MLAGDAQRIERARLRGSVGDAQEADALVERRVAARQPFPEALLQIPPVACAQGMPPVLSAPPVWYVAVCALAAGHCRLSAFSAS